MRRRMIKRGICLIACIVHFLIAGLIILCILLGMFFTPQFVQWIIPHRQWFTYFEIFLFLACCIGWLVLKLDLDKIFPEQEQSEFTKLEGQREQLTTEPDRLAARIWEDYELTYTAAAELGYPPVTAETRSDFGHKQNELKNKMYRSLQFRGGTFLYFYSIGASARTSARTNRCSKLSFNGCSAISKD